MKKDKSKLEDEITIRAKKVTVENEGMDSLVEREERKPEFCLSQKDLEDIKDWQVGEKYTITMEIENISKEKGGWYMGKDDKEIIHSRFKILSIKSKKDKEVDKYKDKFKR